MPIVEVKDSGVVRDIQDWLKSQGVENESFSSVVETLMDPSNIAFDLVNPVGLISGGKVTAHEIEEWLGNNLKGLIDRKGTGGGGMNWKEIGHRPRVAIPETSRQLLPKEGVFLGAQDFSGQRG